MASQQKRNANQAKETQATQRPSQPVAHEKKFIPQTTQLDMLERAIEDPQGATPNDILALQKTAGNRAVSGLIQTKLRVGPVGDQYEQEADRVADKVMRMPAADTTASVQRQAMPEEEELLQGKPLASTITPVVQRQELDEEDLLQGKSLLQRQEDEELLQGKPLVQRQEMEEEELLQGKSLVQRQELEDEELLQGKRVQRQAEPEEEELLQGKFLAQRQELEEEDLGQRKALVQRQAHGGFQANDDTERRLASNRGGGSPLPDHLLSNMEARFGNDFGAVRVHTGGEAEQLNRNLSARAFTHGNDIYMGSSQYSPDSTEGQRLLAHELTHVVQQTGHHKSTAPEKTVSGNKSAFKAQTLQRTDIIQRDTIDNSWEDLLPKEKQALRTLKFSAQGARLLILSQRPRRTKRQTWNGLSREQRAPLLEKAQTILKQTQALKGLGEKGGDVSGLTEWGHFTEYHAFLNSAGINDGNIAQKLAEAQDLVQRYKAWDQIDADAKLELEEKYGISSPEDFANVPRSRAEEIQQILHDAKARKDERERSEQEQEKLKTTRQENEDVTAHPGSGEMMKEGWRRIGTSIKRGFRYTFGGFMSSNLAKRRIYAKKRQALLRSRQGQMPLGRRPRGARPAPTASKPSGPSSEDLKNIMEAVKAIQGSNLGNKDEIVMALLSKAGM